MLHSKIRWTKVLQRGITTKSFQNNVTQIHVKIQEFEESPVTQRT